MWNKLSDADKKIFTDVTQEAADKAGREITQREARAGRRVQEEGQQRHDVVDKNAFRDAVLKTHQARLDLGYPQPTTTGSSAIK